MRFSLCKRRKCPELVYVIGLHAVVLLLIIQSSSVFKLFCFAALHSPLIEYIHNHVFVLSLNVFLFTFLLFCRSSSSTWSIGNLPLWLFLSIFEKTLPFSEIDSTARAMRLSLSCHAIVLTRRLLCSDWLIHIFLEFHWLKKKTIQFFS